MSVRLPKSRKCCASTGRRFTLMTVSWPSISGPSPCPLKPAAEPTSAQRQNLASKCREESIVMNFGSSSRMPGAQPQRAAEFAGPAGPAGCVVGRLEEAVIALRRVVVAPALGASWSRALEEPWEDDLDVPGAPGAALSVGVEGLPEGVAVAGPAGVSAPPPGAAADWPAEAAGGVGASTTDLLGIGSTGSGVCRRMPPVPGDRSTSAIFGRGQKSHRPRAAVRTTADTTQTANEHPRITLRGQHSRM
mmetsp:Transcript_64773/g.193016  ORF Transcript_64773/g.193016 Transcript_64773/m.193016 type:complete len:248 (-) Transcript_64773:104-847(-)